MSGFCYGESEPTEECGLCGGDASAEFCDVGVGMVQIGPYHCGDCGGVLSPRLPDGNYANGWVSAPTASERGMQVTGYYLTHKGHVIEMTFDEGHLDFNQRTGIGTSARLSQGWVRITNLEGFAIDLPSALTAKTRRTLARVLKDIDTTQSWGTAYVIQSGDQFGKEMTRPEIMAAVSLLPHDVEGGKPDNDCSVPLAGPSP